MGCCNVLCGDPLLVCCRSGGLPSKLASSSDSLCVASLVPTSEPDMAGRRGAVGGSSAVGEGGGC